MPPPPHQLCDICRTIMGKLLTTDLPWEDEDGIPHQPNLIALEESTQLCSLCYQLWLAAGRSLANRGGMVGYLPQKKIGDKDVTIRSAASNFAMGGLFRAMANGAMVSNTAGTIEPDLSLLEWVHPRSLVDDPYTVGSYLFGNWWKSPYAGQDDSLMLIGLGVRLGTSPAIGDALGNRPDEWFLAGSYLRVRTKFDSSVAHFIPGCIRNWDLSSDRAIGQVKSWLKTCDEYHKCLETVSDGASGPLLPTRVLCIDGISEKVHLMESQGQRARYIALSHSWGKSHRLTLTKLNLSTLKAGIEMTEIPQTFKDAIIICRTLKIKYLWIDSLCIVQDDPTDWEAEASRMSSVYTDSYLTISAIHSEDDAGGCFPSLARRDKEKPFPFVSPDVICTGRPTIANAVPFVIPKESTGDKVDGYNHAVVFSMHGVDDKKYYITNEWMPPSIESSPKRYGTFNFGASFDPLKHEPLSSRGWVLQERILSPRTLYYSVGQMYWECQSIVLGEDGSMLKRMFPQIQTIVESQQKALQVAANSTNVSSQCIQDEWLKLVEVFCTRKLTMDYDKLVAISGLASIVAEKSGDCYYAGLWKSNFLNSLCWKKKVRVPHHLCSDEEHEHALPDATSAKIIVPSQYRAPSWSWAAIDGEIEFETTLLTAQKTEREEKVAQLIEVSVTPLGPYNFGRVKSGFVKLHTVVGELHHADPITQQAGEVLDQFHVAATLFSTKDSTTGHAKEEEKSANEKPSRLGKLFSGLTVSKDFSDSSLLVLAKVLFDIQPQFPCTVAFITNRFALVLRLNSSDGSYTRIGVAELGGKDIEHFVTGNHRNEVVIV